MPLLEFEDRPSALIVDDNHHIRRQVAAFLRHKGFSVETVDNGPDAIELLQKTHVDVVIADFHLSGRSDGIAVLNYHNRIVPQGARILFTADYSEKLPTICQQINSVYVPKPIPLTDLLVKIKESFPFGERAQNGCERDRKQTAE
jgi:DNA-binding NtrC family response regulator